MTSFKRIMFLICFCLSTLSYLQANQYFFCIIHNVVVKKQNKIILYASTENKDFTQDGETNYYRVVGENNKLPFSLEEIFDTEYYVDYNKHNNTIKISNQLYNITQPQNYEYKKNNVSILLSIDNSFKNMIISSKDNLTSREINMICTEDTRNTSEQIISEQIKQAPIFAPIFFYKVK